MIMVDNGRRWLNLVDVDVGSCWLVVRWLVVPRFLGGLVDVDIDLGCLVVS